MTGKFDNIGCTNGPIWNIFPGDFMVTRIGYFQGSCPIRHQANPIGPTFHSELLKHQVKLLIIHIM